MILGIDEVGRGPWAGPLVVGAVVLGGVQIDGLTDSKKLTKKQREALNVEIRGRAAGYGLGWVSAAEIDDIGLSMALRLAARRAVEAVDKTSASYHEIIIDGTVNFLRDTSKGRFVTTMKKADLLVPSVSAASIIAKVARDNYMAEQGARYPAYGFGSNAGYGVAKHRAAIEQFGVTPLHRLSFAPIVKYANGEVKSPLITSLTPLEHPQKIIRGPQKPARTFSEAPLEASFANKFPKHPAARGNKKSATATRLIGDAGEAAVAEALIVDGHEIVARNWRTKWCEIDIVSRRGGKLYFTEVKYRKNTVHGDGLAAITPRKQRQIRFAAELFLAQNPQFGKCEVHLLAADASGEPPCVRQIVEMD